MVKFRLSFFWFLRKDNGDGYILFLWRAISDAYYFWIEIKVIKIKKFVPWIIIQNENRLTSLCIHNY